jgi:predicted restriction endonuclease
VDLTTWREFFDEPTNSLRSAEVAKEYERLWGEAQVPVPVEGATDSLEREASRQEAFGLEEILKSYYARPTALKPVRRIGTVAFLARDPTVVAITRLRAQYRCEIEGCNNHQFIGQDGNPYVETHHLQMLAEGGVDRIENTAAVCAVHHRELHHGKQRDVLTQQLKEKRLHQSI